MNFIKEPIHGRKIQFLQRLGYEMTQKARKRSSNSSKI